MRYFIAILLVLAGLTASSANAESGRSGSDSQARMVRIDKNTQLYVRTSGHGPTAVLFVPGWRMSSAVFEKQFEHSASSDKYTFISYDPRGQGLSSKTKTGNEYIQHGKDLDALIRALGIQRLMLGGWSNGAYDVTAYLNQFGGSRLSALILIDGPPRCAGTDNTTQWVWYRYDDADHSKQGYTYGALYDRANLDKSFAEWMLENPNAQTVKWLTDIMAQTPNDVAAMTNETCSYMNFEGDVATFAKCKPLLVFAREEWRTVASKGPGERSSGRPSRSWKAPHVLGARQGVQPDSG